MALNILLLLSVLSALSIAALGQSNSISTECTAAHTAFNAACSGSDALDLDLYLDFYSASVSNPVKLYSNFTPEQRQAEIALFNNTCGSQECVNMFANLVRDCLTTFRAQWNVDADVYNIAELDFFTNFTCAKTVGGRRCGDELQPNANDMYSLVYCTLFPNNTDVQMFLGVTCNDTCGVLRRISDELGCCVSSFVTSSDAFLEVRSTGNLSLPDPLPSIRGIYAACNVTDPENCPVTLMNPLRGSGLRVVHSWGLLVGALVSITVVLGIHQG